jgi:deoxyribodipyrimidine photo-lyase
MLTQYQDILEQLNDIDPIKYGKTRNFINGAVTQLSPYISRGVISTRQVLDAMLHKGYKPYQMEQFIKELAWRDYYQRVWQAKGNAIDKDLKNTQAPIAHHKIPTAIVNATTGITAIDNGIKQLMDTGYMHNHIRMYVAGIVCNMAHSHWHMPAQWLYYYLYDADWASNALSWQWVAGSFSSKKYLANQENINNYCNTKDANTWLDKSYEELSEMPIPHILQDSTTLNLVTPLPKSTQPLNINNNWPIYIYNFYNLDPQWCTTNEANKILLLEPSFFEQYPISQATINFIMALANNITDIQIHVGSFDQLYTTHANTYHYKEHPCNAHYKGIEHTRT